MTQQPGGFNPYGAIDLAALAQQRKAQEQAQAGAGEPNGAPPGVAVALDVTDVTFEQDVVQRSMSVPVVLDFWATWCEPCKQLSPVLERFAAQDNGKWVLAKIDVDANQQLAAAAAVQSIPTVMVVWQGQVIPGFSGALPEAQVRDFLDQVLALASGEAGGQAEEPEASDVPDDPDVIAAETAIETGDWEAATEAYERVLQVRPADDEARAGLARVDLLRRTDGQALAAAVAAAAQQPDDVARATLAADLELLSGAADAAFDRLIALVARSEGASREQAKEHLVSLLDLVGNEDPLVLEARRRLANALF